MFTQLSTRLKIGVVTGIVVLAQLLQAVSPFALTAAATSLYPIPLPSPTTPTGSIQICHATNSDGNPYNLESPNTSATGVGGGNGDHASHTGPSWTPTLKDLHISWGDIIPPFTDLNGRSFPGMNWDNDAQIFWQYGCNIANIPTVPSTVAVSSTPCTLYSGASDTVAVHVTNANDVYDNTITYTVTVGTTSKTVALADDTSSDVTFTGLTPGTYTVAVTMSGDSPHSQGLFYTTSQTIIVGSCPVQQETPTPPMPSYSDLCGPDNVSWTIAASGSTTNYTWVTNQDKSITYTATTGSYFLVSGNHVTSITYNLPADTSPLCSSEPIPAPLPVDPCGSGNAYWTNQTDTTTVHWTNIDGKLTATAIGVLFTDGRSSIDFGSATDSNTRCRVDLPAAPTPIDPCGAGNASWSGLPANTSAYVWSLNAGHLAVTATADYIFTDGTTYHDYGTAPDSGDLCPAPQVVNPTCDMPGNITLPALKDDGFSYHYLVTIGLDQKTYDTSALPKVIPVTQGMQVRVMLVREDPWQTQVFNQLYNFEFLSCIDVPEQPAPADPCGTDNASWTKLEDTSSVTWTIDEDGHLIATAIGSLFTNGESTIDYGTAPDSNVLCAPATPSVDVYCGLYNNDQAVLPELSENDHYSWYVYGNDETNTLYVQAIADEGYSFGKDTQTAWEFVDEHTTCTMPPLQTTPKTCHADATVTVEYDTERYYYTIQLADGEEIALDSGTTTLTEVGTYTIRGYEYRYSNDERIMIDEEEGAVFTDTFTVTAPSCEPGKGSITPLPSPIELPHTGSDGLSNLLIALVSAVAVYGAVYFAQPRRS